MRKLLSSGAIVLLSVSLAGCITTSVHVSKDGKTKVTSVGVSGCGNPSQRITRVETEGKADITFGSTGSDFCTVALGSAISAAGQVAGAYVLPGSNISVSSGSINETNTDVNVRTN